MSVTRSAVLAAALVVAAPSVTYSSDLSRVTCSDFLASGTANMAAMMMYLRGYHSGRSGVIAFDDRDQYPQRLGIYCKQHPSESIVAVSEKILSDLSRGI